MREAKSLPAVNISLICVFAVPFVSFAVPCFDIEMKSVPLLPCLYCCVQHGQHKVNDIRGYHYRVELQNAALHMTSSRQIK